MKRSFNKTLSRHARYYANGRGGYHGIYICHGSAWVFLLCNY